MRVITLEDASNSLVTHLAEVNADNSAVTITSSNGNGVLVSEDEYRAWHATMHLFSTAANTRRLTGAIDRSEPE